MLLENRKFKYISLILSITLFLCYIYISEIVTINYNLIENYNECKNNMTNITNYFNTCLDSLHYHNEGS